MINLIRGDRNMLDGVVTIVKQAGEPDELGLITEAKSINRKEPDENEVLSYFNSNSDKFKKEYQTLLGDKSENEVSDFFINFIQKHQKLFGKKISSVIYRAYFGYQYLTPAEKAIFAGHLGYLFLPIDMIPDAIPVVGFADDGLLLGNYMNLAKDTFFSESVTSQVEEAIADGELKQREKDKAKDDDTTESGNVSNYQLTQADKEEIAHMVLAMLDKRQNDKEQEKDKTTETMSVFK